MKRLLIIATVSLSLTYSWAQESSSSGVFQSPNKDFTSETLFPKPQEVSPTIVNGNPLTSLEKLHEQQQKMEKDTNKRTLERLIENRIKSEYELSQKVEESLKGSLNSESSTNQPTQYEVISNGPSAVNNSLEKEIEEEGLIAAQSNHAASSSFGLSSSDSPSYYIGGLAGMVNYSSQNVQSRAGAGLVLGGDISDHFSLEAFFIYSRHLIDEMSYYWTYDVYQEVDQYNVGATGKFSFFKNKAITPYLGGTLSVTIRDYTELGVMRALNNINISVQNLNRDGLSTTLDGGVSAGIDINFPNNFSVGFDWKYMLNIYQQQNDFNFGQYANNGLNFGRPMERARYNILSVTGKVRF